MNKKWKINGKNLAKKIQQKIFAKKGHVAKNFGLPPPRERGNSM